MAGMANATRAHHVASGKVREIYDLGDGRLAIVATDRVSAYHLIHDAPVPDKGRVLTQMTLFWLDLLAGVVPNHLVSAADADVAELPPEVGDPDWLSGRTMIVHKAEMFPVECIVRGYLAGSAWREYAETGHIVAAPLPTGLRRADRLPATLFTPSTKAETGHDENIDVAAAGRLVGDDVAAELARLSVAVYDRAAAHAATRGVLVADTKFEFGLVGGRVTLCDEVLTPDSSRFWYARDWEPGTEPPALDKQLVRDWLDSTGWDHTPPAPRLPADVVARARDRYVEVYEVLSGRSFT